METGIRLRVYIVGETGAADVMGLWQIAPGDQRGTVWDVDVTANAAQGDALLQEPARRVSAAALAIPDAEVRLQRFLRQGAASGISFAAPAPELPEPERRLALWLAPEAAAYGLGELPEELAQALQRAHDFSEMVQRALGQAVLVRSRAGGRTLCCTRVSWTGDARTAWATGLSRADAAVHEQAVRLALSTFQGWVRIVTLMGASAVRLSASLPSGIGIITALPAVWGFITDILEEYQQLRRQPSS
ncbi:MAG TPA: hypothetical protein VE553_06770 [Candidatus Binatia bacterium]|nr:hypothetical protein [Candidatus Binatia bacterium]